MRDDVLVFETEDGENVEMLILEETKVNGTNYILVTDSEDEDGKAYIFKDISDTEDEDAIYEPVEDDGELEVLGKIFAELMDEDTEVVF